jgi:DNA-binding response OmpR family regulator
MSGHLPRVLVVEDEFTTAIALEYELGALGYEPVGPVGRVRAALQLVQTSDLDMAIVDLDLHGEMATPVIRALQEHRVPVLISTAYSPSDVPKDLRDLPRLEKPFTSGDLQSALHSLAAA